MIAMARTQLLAICALGLLISSASVAVEPPRATIHEALAQAKAGFVGRIVGIREATREPFVTNAVAEIEVSRCLCGDGCKVGKTVRLRFKSQTTREREFAVVLPISDEVVILFAQSRNVPLEMPFNSGWGGLYDFGYAMDSYPDEYPDQGSSRRVRSVYTLAPGGILNLADSLSCGMTSSDK